MAILWRQGVAKQKWYFGNDGSPTGTAGCNAANDQKYIINIPVCDIFYDSPITSIGYTPLALPPPAFLMLLLQSIYTKSNRRF
ncbi:10584_t:CDS:2 [Funneliformis geosporum]|nr:10584_t:CDS:2 [Funneliformis geosporum]